MIENSRQESGGGGDDIGMIKTEKLISKAVTPSTSSRQWTAFRNPRIVRVSRSLGGKDRHSKVCTIRGLRDRRIRLSVPTAIQLYDLQDRLGLNQPSKVVDWLIEATKSDIDKLPPLHIPHSFSHQFHHPHQQQTLLQFPPPPQYESHPEVQLPPGTSFSLGGSFYDHAPNHQNLIDSLSSSSSSRLKGKEAEGTTFKTNEQHNNKLFQFGTNNAIMGYNSSYNNSDPNSSLSLSQFGSHGLYPNSSSAMQFSSPPNNLSVPAQLLFCPSSSATPSSLFTSTPHAPFMANSSVESDNHHPRQSNINHIQFLSSLSSTNSQIMPHALRRHHLTPFSSKLLDSDHDDNNHSQPADMGSNDRS